MAQSQINTGVLLVFSKHEPSKIGEWLEKSFLSSLRSSVTIESASIYAAVHSGYNKPTLAAFEISDIGKLQSNTLSEILHKSQISSSDGTEGSVHVDARVYNFVQLYELDKKPTDAAPKLLLALMQPSPEGAEELDAWYRDEHNEQMSKEPGWWRTTRYSLVNQSTIGGAEPDELSFLAIHAFGEGNHLGTEVKALEPISEWTMKILKETKGIDAAIYDLVKKL